MVHFTFYHVCLCVCFLLYVYHTSTEDSKGQRRVSDALELKLQTILASWSECWNQTHALCKSTKYY